VHTDESLASRSIRHSGRGHAQPAGGTKAGCAASCDAGSLIMVASQVFEQMLPKDMLHAPRLQARPRALDVHVSRRCLTRIFTLASWHTSKCHTQRCSYAFTVDSSRCKRRVRTHAGLHRLATRRSHSRCAHRRRRMPHMQATAQARRGRSQLRGCTARRFRPAEHPLCGHERVIIVAAHARQGARAVGGRQGPDQQVYDKVRAPRVHASAVLGCASVKRAVAACSKFVCLEV
jgi:hypothetical protein